MKVRLAILALAAVALACSEQAQSPTMVGPEATMLSQAPPAGTPQQAQRFIVVMKGNQTVGSLSANSTITSMGLTPDYVFQRVLPGFTASLTPAQVALLRADPQVAYVEPDQVVNITGTQSPAPSWGLDRVDQRDRPLDNSYTYPNTGSGVHFYGIDTGIRGTHQDFTGRMGNGFTSILDGRGTNDCHGHGTHTASTAAGTTYGVAKGMTVHPVRVLDCFGSGFTSGVVAGIDWVTNNAVFPAVANMSLGGVASNALDQAVAASVAAGVVYSVSAGNADSNACLQSPAREPSAITVGSTTSGDARSSFSNWGSCVDIFAPGSFIIAAWATSNTATANLSGTSMSAPHVAGAAGLYMSANPGKTPAQVVQALTSNASVGKISQAGTGSPNLLLYVGFIGGGGPPPPPPNQPPVASFTFDCTDLTCDFDGTGSTDDNGITSYGWSVGGSSIGSGATTTHTFASAGTYNVTLTVTDAGGLSDTDTQAVTVTDPGPGNQAPVADFTWSCDATLFCTFDGSSSTDDVGVVSYEWYIGGVKKASGAVVTKKYNNPTTFQLTLRVTDAGGLFDEQTQSIDVGGSPPPPPPNQPPVASFTFNCSGLTCNFDGSGSTDDVGITSYDWDVAGNPIGSGVTTSHTFASAGTYNVTLTVTDGGGLTGTQTRSVTVTAGGGNQAPVAAYTWSCTVSRDCTFDGTSSTDDGGIVSYTWTLPNGRVVGTGPVMTQSFSGPRTFTLTLTVVDGPGLSDTETQTISVP